MDDILQRDQNSAVVMGGITNDSNHYIRAFRVDPVTGRLLVSSVGGAGGGTVTSIAIATANGFSGTSDGDPATPTLTIQTTVTGILQGNGTAVSAITVGSGLSFSAGTLTATGSGTGTVTNVSSANGNATVANPTTTPVITIVSAPKLTTGRTISITGDLAYTSASFDGSGNVTAAGTLATVNANVGSFGSATQAGTFTVNAKGLVTAAGNTTVTPAVGSITGFGAGVATWLATPSSANFAAAVTGETGTGSVVFSNSPTLVTPALGTPTTLVATNATGTATGLTSGITNALKSVTTTIDVSAATAPTVGQALIATDATHATWQNQGYPYGFGATGTNTAQSLPTTTSTTVAFDTQNWDFSSEFDTTTFTYTPTTAGYYQVNANVYFVNVLAGTFCEIGIVVNGSYVVTSSGVPGGNQDFTQPISGIVHLDIGDTLVIQAYQNSGLTKTLYVPNSSFSAQRLV